MEFDRVWTMANWERLLVGDLFNQGVVGGLLLTLLLGMSAIVLSTVLGSIVGIMRSSSSRAMSIPSMVYVQAFRNVPLLILVFWAYFFPSVFGGQISKFASVLIALTLFNAAYIAEIISGGIRSVGRGHVEAARALGLN